MINDHVSIETSTKEQLTTQSTVFRVGVTTASFSSSSMQVFASYCLGTKLLGLLTSRELAHSFNFPSIQKFERRREKKEAIEKHGQAH